MILDTFTLLFNSNTDQVKKGTEEVEKSTKQLEKTTKDTAESTKKLGEEFSKVVEKATVAIGAVLSVAAIKAGLINTAEFNAALGQQSKLLQTSAQDILQWGGAVTTVGGSTQEFIGTLQGIRNQYAGMGLVMPPVLDVLTKLNRSFQTMSASQQFMIAQKMGIDEHTLLLLQKTPQEFDAIMARQKELSKISAGDTEKAQAFVAEIGNTEEAFRSLFTEIDSQIGPSLTKFFKNLEDGIIYVRDHKEVMEGVITGMSVALGVMGVAAVLAFAPFFAAAAEVTIVAGLMGTLVTLFQKDFGVLEETGAHAWDGLKDGLADALDFIAKEVNAFFQSTAAGRWLAGKLGMKGGLATDHLAKQLAADAAADRAGIGQAAAAAAHPGASSGAGATPTPSAAAPTGGTAKDKAVSFFMQNGYTQAQAQGIVANMIRESQLNPNAVGDSGHAHGIEQWHEDRRQQILKGTGIDVNNATFEQQLQASLWELNNTEKKHNTLLQQSTTPEQAAATFSKYIERPRDQGGEMAQRAQIAAQLAASQSTMSLADASPLTSQGPNSDLYSTRGDTTVNHSMNVGSVEIQTQATDSKQIAEAFSTHLAQQYRAAASNIDDGVLA